MDATYGYDAWEAPFANAWAAGPINTIHGPLDGLVRISDKDIGNHTDVRAAVFTRK